MMRASPIDYAAIRRGLCAAITDCTGLGQNSIILAMPELPGAPLPAYPFIMFAISGVARRLGQDDRGWSVAEQCFVQTGARELTVNFDCLGKTHEEAWGLAAMLQQGLDGPESDDGMALGGLSVWGIGDAIDLSSLEGAGFEGRARLSCRFGVMARRRLSLGVIDTVPLHGIVADVVGDATIQDATVTLETTN